MSECVCTTQRRGRFHRQSRRLPAGWLGYTELSRTGCVLTVIYDALLLGKVREQPGSLKPIENVLNGRCPVRFLNLSTDLRFVSPGSSLYAPEKRPLIVLHPSRKDILNSGNKPHLSFEVFYLDQKAAEYKCPMMPEK